MDSLSSLYCHSTIEKQLCSHLEQQYSRLHISGMCGSLPAVLVAATFLQKPASSHLVVCQNKEDAYYFVNDLEHLLPSDKSVLLFPTSYRKVFRLTHDDTDNANVMMRSEVVRALSSSQPAIVVTYADALSEKIVSRGTLKKSMLHLSVGDTQGLDHLLDALQTMSFEREEFVVQPGQFSLRGGIIDVFSMAHDKPYRICYDGDTIESIRTFDVATQLSIDKVEAIDIVPDFPLQDDSGQPVKEERVSLLEYFSSSDIFWCDGITSVLQQLDNLFNKAEEDRQKRLADTDHPIAGILPTTNTLCCTAGDILHLMLSMAVVEYGANHYFSNSIEITSRSEPQPFFDKQLDFLEQNLQDYAEKGYTLLLSVSNSQQQKRLETLMDSWSQEAQSSRPHFSSAILSHGFIDHDQHLLCYTDHELFGRYHKYSLKNLSDVRESLTLKELFDLKPGDYVTHIDYGVGRFSGLEKVTKDGKSQELIRLIYKNNDVLYISIHGLHKISRYVGREGETPQLNRLGSNSWQVLKQKTKSRVKDIAKDLIALYAKRKASHGFAFSLDSVLQQQLEASFLYEDTPDQMRTTQAVKTDMEASSPMDRLVCGDVGFGKTEIAIRAAFKACCDSKQVAVLVPSTILAFQHYNTFCERLKDMPVRIEYINRFRTTKEKNQIFKDVESGKIDILIGTHAITNSSLHFKDLGLLIIDEEQKFGVSVKEKLKQLKVGVDCLTLTATPIPRTLQFSLMGARDLSVIQTPPPNRQPIDTTLSDFDEELIRDAIAFEMSRGGQVFFVNDRVENLTEVAGMVQRLVPDSVVAMAHGRMEGKEAEETLMRFLEGEIDILVATSIVENGLDIPNANTIIINNAHKFGLSDLHQMRGRVGRSNKKAFCYLLIPSYLNLTTDAQRRLKAIEEFSTIGSGFNIAMRDLDIRGAGNILGAEQSGFISEIGYDMYHKILDEAIDELKHSDFKELFQDEDNKDVAYVKECLIETDLEVLLPDDYVASVGERLLLYRQLNDLLSDQELDTFRYNLIDRFGPLPHAADELIKTITLRRIAKEMAIEKMVLKQGRMACHFVGSHVGDFYQSDLFPRIILYAQANAKRVHLKDSDDHLILTIDNVADIDTAISQIQNLTNAK